MLARPTTARHCIVKGGEWLVYGLQRGRGIVSEIELQKQEQKVCQIKKMRKRKCQAADNEQERVRQVRRQ